MKRPAASRRLVPVRLAASLVGVAVAMLVVGVMSTRGADTSSPSLLPATLWPRPTDYTLTSWLHGFPARVPGAPWQRCVRTGRYAFVLDTTSITIPHLGPLPPAAYRAAVREDPGVITALPAADLGLFIHSGGTTYRCTAGNAWNGLEGPRLVESGRWVQRSDVQGLLFVAANGDVLPAEARLETVSWPDRLTVLLAARPALEPLAAGDACFGRLDGGYGFDGRNHLDVPLDPVIDPARFTLEAWVYVPADFAAATRAVPWLVCKEAHEEADGHFGISIHDGKPRARLNIGGGKGNAFTATSNVGFATEAWNHVAITYDGTTLRLFLDGEPRAEQRVDRERRPGRHGMTFGRRQDAGGDGYHFKGAIDEVRLHDSALSPEQIRERFRHPERPPVDPQPVFVRSFRAEGTAASTRPRSAWRSAGLAVRLEAAGVSLERRIDLPDDRPLDAWHEVAVAYDPAALPAGTADGAAVPPVTVVAVPLGAEGTGAPLRVVVDENRGWHRIDLDPVAPMPPESRAPDVLSRPGVVVDRRNDGLERVRLTLGNPSHHEQPLRLLFAKTAFRGGPRIGAPITGVSAILRTAKGEPTGIPVQLSKNWHSGRGGAPYSGQWFHGFTLVRLPPRSTVELELAVAYGHWGGVAAASHAQLSLLGWGTNQLWEESAVGSWGESICYEPDQIQGRCSILDVRPLMVASMNAGKPWGWTRNVGGGDFFRLVDRQGNALPHASMKAACDKSGPCLTEVTYAGRIGGGIDHAETVSLARTDDILRGTYRIRMDVREPVAFSRLVIFQVGADTYNYARERRLAIGDASGLIHEWDSAWGGNSYRTEPLECRGLAPWASLHETDDQFERQSGGQVARGVVIRSWRAVLGGREARPWIAEHGCVARGVATSTIDIVPPPAVNRLEPGDFVEATIEHVVLPVKAADYYGPNGPLREALAGVGGTWRMVHREAAQNDRRVDVVQGELVQLHPDVRVKTDRGRAEFLLQNGLGYVPLTFTGLDSPRRGTLHFDGTVVNQTVHGNDFWQTDYDADTRTWSHTFTVPSAGDGPRRVVFDR